MKIRIYNLFFFTLLFLASCLDSPEMTDGIVNGKKTPTVRTANAASISNDGILHLEGEINSTGKSSEILAKGFYWSYTNPDPTDTDNCFCVNLDPKETAFSVELSNIPGGKTIYWKAFAKNEFGFDYGEVKSCSTPPVWEEKANFVAPIRGFFSFCLLNDELFLFGGQKSTSAILLNETWIYNTKSDTWSSNRVDFEGVRRYPASFVIDNTIYMGIGQRTGTDLYDDFYRMDKDFTWEKIPTEGNMEARYNSGAFSLNGKGYIIGGSRATYPYTLKDVWQLDPKTKKWERLKDFPVLFTEGISIYDNNRAFIGFGKKENEEPLLANRYLWEYNDTDDSWSVIAELPDDFTSKISGGTFLKNAIYVINSKLEIWKLDLETQEWELKTMAPEILQIDIEEGKHLMQTYNNSIFIGLNFSEHLFEYRPLWDNE